MSKTRNSKTKASRTNWDASRPRRRRYRLSPQGLASLRAAAARTRPWLLSTGPRTDAGKAVSRMNALLHGERTAKREAERREVTELFRLARFYDDVAANHLAGAIARRGL